MSDIRYSFLNTLDYLPCDIVRTLWLLQTLDGKLRDLDQSDEQFKYYGDNLKTQSRFLGDLVGKETGRLQDQTQELEFQLIVKKRYNTFLKNKPHLIKKLNKKLKKPAVIKTRKNKMKLSINLKQLRKEVIKEHRSNSITPTPTSDKSNNNNSNDIPEDIYCWCQQPSFGDMVACDNDNCPREWFHYSCVGITKPPKGKWFCSTKCQKEWKTKSRQNIKQHRN
ncbi:similar to Saccharomyces cerevisiae YOR064C YNG1 Subunit of the NuA3 histone acetyltransferase complex that acetylates histone H3 [Maudiozyma saulgeensis]|uniref:Similar to Saccharomyces cerevisiae YOR064C YNG1 Subunit of the NuA3 histone acetyltransferase complex that acetylates histone H3 n=1 Tax=Maudiozyma saulgeensis TaxID=1789683 RepID=A0A1X7QXF5_9SACH|nr:similar to Saccharomyces cerevisiae YOR064C YNG1 Subunit of the NuA3 histone acetyltransferase complex that acetylates histone H3 [Kazachstania saulgeensis]